MKDRFPLREEQVLMYLDGDLPEEAIQQEMRLAVSAAAVLCTLRCAVLCCAPESSRRCGWQHMSPPLAHEPTPAAHAVLAVAV